VPGEAEIPPDSKIRLSFHAHLHAFSDPRAAEELSLEDSEDEDEDLNILLQRKKRRNAGDAVNSPAAHLPHYPEVFS
jgi:hypothetical protein